MKSLVLRLIRFYQTLSRSGPPTPFLLGSFSGCRSWPTCSEFAYESVSQKGAIQGCALAVRRVLGCHSFWRNESANRI